VTAVQVQPVKRESEWQKHYRETKRLTTQILSEAVTGD
jgi:hypothetical protein